MSGTMKISTVNSHDDRDDELAFLREEVKRLHRALGNCAPSLDQVLQRRGFRIYKKEPVDDLLVPAPGFIDGYIAMLHRYSFRLFLRDVIKRQDLFTLDDVTKYATGDVTREYVQYALDIGLIQKAQQGYALAKRPIRSFGTTLEWYLAELLRRDFGAEAAWGVKFRRPAVGGDYDVIARFDSALLYVEVKSSPPKQVYDSEVAAFLDRVQGLAPEAAVFFMDTELRMKDKIVPLFEGELEGRKERPAPVVRMERELFRIGERIFLINAKESIQRNLERVFLRHYRALNSGA